MNSHKDNRHCAWCGDPFDSKSDRARLRHCHAVFRRPMRSDTSGKVFLISGKLCCRCRNIQRAHVPDEIRNNEPVVESAGTHYYPTGNYRLVVVEPGISSTVKL